MTSNTSVLLDVIPGLQPALVQRAVSFAAVVAELNRNRNYVGERHQPVGLVTDTLPKIGHVRPDIKVPADQELKYAGMCWSGSDRWGPTIIWVNPLHSKTRQTRSYMECTETLVHELAHAFTSGQHGWTFRRMYALLEPHLMELFGVPSTTVRVHALINRYQRKHLTERVTGPYSWLPVGPNERRHEEWEKHIQASERMKKRLIRQRIAP